MLPHIRASWPPVRQQCGAHGTRAGSGEVDAGSLAALRASQRADKNMRKGREESRAGSDSERTEHALGIDQAAGIIACMTCAVSKNS
jgi:hypothetical protein